MDIVDSFVTGLPVTLGIFVISAGIVVSIVAWISYCVTRGYGPIICFSPLVVIFLLILSIAIGNDIKNCRSFEELNPACSIPKSD